MADATFKRGQRVELQEVAEATGLHRTTLYRMVNVRGYNATLNNIDVLCRYFGCGVGDLAVYVPDEEVPQALRPSATDKANA
ncbi:helix-turn-helix domain-containing protein [Caballeronia sp. EK]|uniref:helix-turn-helix domain-containing protein n=1 Tax=Caballeronia sp. EK TaxID=2767469 RepID=UPI001CA41A9C